MNAPQHKIRARVATTMLLTRHIVRTMAGHGLRSFMVWLALASALAVIIGVVSFVRSIDDSFKARGEAVRGIADLQVQAVDRATLPKDLAADLEKLKGTKYAVAIDEQRISIKSRKQPAVTATAFGIDRRARKLQSDLQRELDVRTPRNPENGGLTISTAMADELGVKRGDKVRVLAYQRSPAIKIRRIVEVSPALQDVVALPRKSVENLRGKEGEPNTIFVKLDDGTSMARWQKRADRILPNNSSVVTPVDQQHELDTVLNFTTRSYTYVFGAVALLIGALLVYVLQLMRMLDRQEDAGLVRALGSNWGPLAAAEVLVVGLMLMAALPAGLLLGHWFQQRLGANLPDYLTQVFNFKLTMAVQPEVVAAAVAATLAVAAFATVGALITTRRPVADQMGRSPQSGATSIAGVSLIAALTLTGLGLGCLLLGALLSSRGQFTATSALMLLGIAFIAPGLAALLVHGISLIKRNDGTSVLVARSALESQPRRVGMSVAIMALAVGAVIPLQLIDHALQTRVDRLAAVHAPDVRRIVASSDSFGSVPVRPDYVRRAVEGQRKKLVIERPKPPVVSAEAGTPAAAQARAQAAAKLPTREQLVRRAQRRELKRDFPKHISPFATGFVRYDGNRIGMMALDPANKWPYQTNEGVVGQLKTMRKHPDDVVISSSLASWTDLETGDRIKMPTAEGPRKVRVAAVVDDVGWPLGTVYFSMDRFRELYGWEGVNALIVKPSKLDFAQLKKMRPLHTYSGAELTARIQRQMEMTRSNMLAMRMLIVLAAMVAISGILATSVLARRREWGVLRAVGMTQGKLLRALVIEIAVILLLGAAIGIVGGLLTFQGPMLSFMESRGFPVGDEIVVLPLLVTAAGAIAVGAIAVIISALMVARTKLTDALAYE
jgi:putative ABC transport system permease protein